MKTIRTNCFETNSSSTHSYTVSAPSDLSLKPAQTFVTEDGIVNVRLNAGEPSDSLLGKLTFLLTATYHIGDQEAFDRVVKVVEEFAKVKLNITEHEWVKGAWEKQVVTEVAQYDGDGDEDEDEDESEHPGAASIKDEFSSWIDESAHETVDDFISEVAEATETEQAILVFVFSDVSPFSTYTSYN